MSDKKKDIRVSHKCKYQNQYNDYTIRMVHRRRPWWLLLLLLPLLLLIQCHKDITVTVVDRDTQERLPGQEVTMSYMPHHLWWAGHLLPASVQQQKTQTTDTQGQTTFSRLPCSVYSYIFYCLSPVTFTVESDCYGAEKRCNFHYTRHTTLELEPRREDLHVQLADLDTGDPLPDATLIYRWVEGGEQHTDSVKADAQGVATLPQMRLCSVVELLHGRCYGYADTTRAQVPGQLLLLPQGDSATLRLRPIKERFTFFVKDKETRQPIAAALCTVTLTHPRGSQQRRQVTTSIDGKGIAVYDNAFILSTIAIHAAKKHYKDGDLEGGPWTVQQFIRQDDDTRTVWLEPEPYVSEFINTDSLTGQPVPGVKNIIIITDPSGRTDTTTEVSNRNGCFPVKAKAGSKVEIRSEKSPTYKPGRKVIPSFDEGERVPLMPNQTSLTFRTVTKEGGPLVPQCNLKITASQSGTHQPTSSGQGEFTVTGLQYGERISIVSSKQGYATNSKKINNADVNQLLTAPQTARDIPMVLDVPPCSGGTIVPRNGVMQHRQQYNMGQSGGIAALKGDAYSQYDTFTVYDGPDTSSPAVTITSGGLNDGKPVPSGGKLQHVKLTNKFYVPFSFSSQVVTVVIETYNGGSDWKYEVECPR